MKIVCKHGNKTWECYLSFKEIEGKRYYYTLVPTELENIGGMMEVGKDSEEELFKLMIDSIKKNIAKNTVFKDWEVEIINDNSEHDC